MFYLDKSTEISNTIILFLSLWIVLIYIPQLFRYIKMRRFRANFMFVSGIVLAWFGAFIQRGWIWLVKHIDFSWSVWNSSILFISMSLMIVGGSFHVYAAWIVDDCSFGRTFKWLSIVILIILFAIGFEIVFTKPGA